MTVTNSCCCFGLRTGAMIIGWFGLVSGILGMLTYIQAVSTIHDVIEMLNYTLANSSSGMTEDQNILMKVNEGALKSIFYTMIGVEVITILICASLLWGVYKNNHLMLIPWLLMNGLYLGVAILLILIMSISCFVGKAAVPGIVILVVGLLMLILPVYFWLCIFSLYQRFRLEENRGGRRCNEEGFGVSAPMMETKPPAYVHKL